MELGVELELDNDSRQGGGGGEVLARSPLCSSLLSLKEAEVFKFLVYLTFISSGSGFFCLSKR